MKSWRLVRPLNARPLLRDERFVFWSLSLSRSFFNTFLFERAYLGIVATPRKQKSVDRRSRVRVSVLASSKVFSIPSGMVLGYDMGRRDPKPISFKRYGTKLKTGYPMGWYICGTIPRDGIFMKYFSGG